MRDKTKRRVEEHNRYLLQRALELYKIRVRQRAARLIAEFLNIRRPPIRVTMPKVKQLVEAVFKGRRQVRWMYRLVLKYRGRWLAIKWGWYIRTHDYWREKFEELAKLVDLYYKYYRMISRGNIEYILARLSAWADSYEVAEPELCTARATLGPVGEAVKYFRRITVYDRFRIFAEQVARAWPNRRYKVIIAMKERSMRAERESDKAGLYVTDFGFGRKRYWIYSFRIQGKDLPELVRTYADMLEVLQIYTLDPPPVAPQCE